MKRKNVKDKYPKTNERKKPKRKLNDHDSDESYVPEKSIVIPKVSKKTKPIINDVSKKNISVTNKNDDYQSDDFDEDKLYIPQDAVVVPRKHNRKFDETKFNLTKRQLTYYTQVLNKDQSNDYYTLETDLERNSKVQEIIRIKFKDTFLFKYNEDRQEFHKLNEKEMFDSIKSRLVNLRSVHLKRPTKKLKINLRVINKFASHARMANYPIPIPKPYMANDYLNPKLFNHFYGKSTLLKDWNKWHYYSMFHSLYQSFSTIVYTYSHKICDEGIIHRCTRTKINFPNHANCLLLIHGRLIHSGSESKFENALSYNQSHDVRLFSYIFKDPDKKEMGKNKNNRKSKRLGLDMYTNHLQEGEVDTNTFKLCGSDCVLCKERIPNKEIDISKIYNEHQRDVGDVSYRYTDPLLLAGDLDKLGWAVYTGVDISKSVYRVALSNQIRRIVGKSKTNWYGINNTKRCAFKIDNLLLNEANSIEKEYKCVYDLYTDIKKKVLIKIPQLKNGLSLQKSALLANFGILDEQRPHRDYSSVRTDDPSKLVRKK